MKPNLFPLLVFIIMTACTKIPSIKTDDATVLAPKNPGEPATLAKDVFDSKIEIPKGTEVKVTYRADAVFYEFKLDEPTEFSTQASMLRASTGKIDTELAKHEADNRTRKFLLWGAGICAVLGAVAVLKGWPQAGIILGAASGACLLIWKMSELPAWIFAIVGLPLLAAGIWWGYSRAEKQLKPDATAP